MNLQSIRTMQRKPGVIPAMPTNIITSRTNQRLARREVVLGVISANNNIGQVALINKCCESGIGEQSTIRRDIRSLVKNKLVNVVVLANNSHKLVMA